MAITIYNTLLKQKEEFVPIETGKVKMYLCGPTVYNFFHIGNARPLIMFDIFRRYLRFRGFDVTYVTNITDIDDRIIRQSIEENIPASQVAAKYTDAYFEDLSRLGVEKPDINPKATDHIEEMIQKIQQLIDHGYAYSVNGDVFYRVDKFDHYGSLSGKNIDELKAGARVDIDERKHAPLDFALWKSAKPMEPFWESPWGKGRPGWHIECSVMSTKYLGETFDIHAGGADLIFPHHENEIAQSEAATGKKFVNYWMHNGFLNIEGEKMSKSLGNFFTAREILDKYSPEAIRTFFLLKHYRSPINFSEERMEESRQALERINATLNNIESMIKDVKCAVPASPIIVQIRDEFIQAMDDDFNTASAMGKLFDLIKEANVILANETIDENEKCVLREIRETIHEFNAFLGIIPQKRDQVPGFEEDTYLRILIDIRNLLRERKEWQLADVIRNRLKEIGIELKDKKEKTVWTKNL